MKILQLTVLTAALCFLSLKSDAQSPWDFQFGFNNTFSPNALNYVVQQQNIEQTSEGPSSSCYWNPINNGSPAILTQEFTFPGPTTEIFLNATIATYNFGGSEFGYGSIWGSKDGANWTLLENAPTPSYPGYPYGDRSTYQADLPSSLLGANQIYIQVQLNTSEYNIMAQFSRTGNNGINPGDIFDLDANYSVPEPSAAMFAIGWLALLLVRRKVGK
jgi:hypothetical protein